MVNEWVQEPNKIDYKVGRWPMTELGVCCVFILKSCATPYTFKALPKCWGTHTQKHTTRISLLVSETSQTGFSFTNCWIIQTCATTVSHDLTDKGQAQLYKRFSFFSFLYFLFFKKGKECVKQKKNRGKKPVKMLTTKKLQEGDRWENLVGSGHTSLTCQSPVCVCEQG